MKQMVLTENKYAEMMQTIVEPYLEERKQKLWLEREEGKKIHCMKYTADDAKGVVMISHGFTESIEKYVEVIYYFLKHKYYVYMPEHCGHGFSYRLVENMSLVHVDSYERYVDDFLFVCEYAKREFEQLPFYLFGHSMGGGIAAVVAAQSVDFFKKVVLTSPMIRPTTGKIPWLAAKLGCEKSCKEGNGANFIGEPQSYQGREKFEDSCSLSRARFDYYQDKKFNEVHYQTCAASYGWVNEAVRMNEYLQKEAWKKITVPMLVFQAENENLVSKEEQDLFVKKVVWHGVSDSKLVKVPACKHEIFNADDETVKKYWKKIFTFFEK